MNSFQIFLTLDEINLILTALGKEPCADVFDVVVNLRQQTQVQMQAQAAEQAQEAEKPVVAALDKAVRRGRKPKAEEAQEG